MSQKEVMDASIQENLQQVFSRHQQQLRAVVEESAAFLRAAAISARQFQQQMDQGTSTQVQSGSATADTGHLKPLSEGFVGQVQRQAQEMFDEIGRAPARTRSGSQVPLTTAPPLEGPSGPVLEDPLAATSLLMKQATEHLNAAMESVLQGMKGHLAGTLGANKLSDVADAIKHRVGELPNRQ